MPLKEIQERYFGSPEQRRKRRMNRMGSEGGDGTWDSYESVKVAASKADTFFDGHAKPIAEPNRESTDEDEELILSKPNPIKEKVQEQLTKRRLARDTPSVMEPPRFSSFEVAPEENEYLQPPLQKKENKMSKRGGAIMIEPIAPNSRLDHTQRMNDLTEKVESMTIRELLYALDIEDIRKKPIIQQPQCKEQFTRDH